ncbi:MAG: NEW3 domain-containing protein [Sphaerochaeta sp.]
MNNLQKKKAFFVSLVVLLFCLSPLMADYEGLSISTDYPALNVSDSDMIVFNLKVNNYNLAPGRVDLSVTDLPKDWDYQFVGGGGKVSAVFAAPEQPVSVQLWVIPTTDVKPGEYNFNVVASGDNNTASYKLPLTVELGQKLQERLSLTTELNEISGSPKSDFTFQVTIANNSAKESLINLDADVPNGFKATFEQQYASKVINDISIGAGKTSTVKVEVTPSQGVNEGTYPVTVIAKTATTSASIPVKLNIKGQANLTLTGENDILSFKAVAGKDKIVPLTIKNTGTADASDIKVSASTPSNWNATFTPSTVETLAAGDKTTVNMTVTPSSQAITGDYGLTVRASSDSSNISQSFRATIETSSLWGLVAVLIIALAAVILLLAVKKFGRR